MGDSTRELCEQLRDGYVSRQGFRTLWDAECYGNAASLGALRKWLKELEVPLRAGKPIEVEGDRIIASQPELIAWIEEQFPDTYACFYKDH